MIASQVKAFNEGQERILSVKIRRHVDEHKRIESSSAPSEDSFKNVISIVIFFVSFSYAFIIPAHNEWLRFHYKDFIGRLLESVAYIAWAIVAGLVSLLPASLVGSPIGGGLEIYLSI